MITGVVFIILAAILYVLQHREKKRIDRLFKTMPFAEWFDMAIRSWAPITWVPIGVLLMAGLVLVSRGY